MPEIDVNKAIEIYKQYLDIKGFPEEKKIKYPYKENENYEYEMQVASRQECFNEALHLAKLSQMKKLEGIREAMLKEFTLKADGIERPLATIDNIVKFIRQHMGGK
jgi:hypothetical protein